MELNVRSGYSRKKWLTLKAQHAAIVSRTRRGPGSLHGHILNISLRKIKLKRKTFYETPI